MELQILKEDKDLLEIEIAGESHTLCNVLRNELWNLGELEFASYRISHPLVSEPILALKCGKGNPRKVLQSAVTSLKSKTKELRSQLSKLE